MHANTPQKKRGDKYLCTPIYAHTCTILLVHALHYTTHTHTGTPTQPSLSLGKAGIQQSGRERGRAQRSCERQGGGGQEEREQTEEIKEVGRQNRGTILRQRGPNIQRGVSSITCIRAEDRVNGGGGNLTQIWTLTVRDIPRADRQTRKVNGGGWAPVDKEADLA